MQKDKKALGDLAERLVFNYFKSKGSSVEFSTNKYDSQKDLIVDGKTVEVKFQTIYHFFKSYCFGNNKIKAFTVPITVGSNKLAQNQLDKCLNVDRWIIVQNPSDRLREKTIKIWEAPPLGERRFGFSLNSKDMRIVAGFPLSTFNLLVDIDDKPLYNKIKSLDFSKFS